MAETTLVANDVLYLSFYLKEEDATTGSITAYNLSGANNIIFRMREVNATINTINAAMETIASPSATLGYCRVLVTIPSAGTYNAEIEIYEVLNNVTFKCQTYKVLSDFG